MGDYASTTLTIYDIPEGRAGETFQEIIGHWDVIEITAGDPIYMEDQSLTIVDELGGALEKLGVTFDLYQDAKYEYDGNGWLCIGRPVTLESGRVVEPGIWCYTGGGSGEPMVTTHEIEAILNDPSLDEDDPGREAAARLNGIRGLLGSDHRAAVKVIAAEVPEPRTWAIEAVAS